MCSAVAGNQARWELCSMQEDFKGDAVELPSPLTARRFRFVLKLEVGAAKERLHMLISGKSGT